MSSAMMQRLALVAAGAAFAGLGIMAAADSDVSIVVTGLTADSIQAPLAPGDSSGTDSTASPSYAPTNPVDCTDPNNVVNCQNPPLDSPLAPAGTAAPGSPLRD